MRTPMALAITCLLAPLALPSTAQQEENSPADYEKTAPLFASLGDHTHPINTDVPLAQTYFDQGLVLAFGFNHAEAARSFRESQKLDPDCAMAYWGEALVLGPNINAHMPKDHVPEAWQALQQAQAHASGASQRHQDYIAALANRYRAEPIDDRSRLDRAYADAMYELARKYPEDYDAQTLAAEALMDTTPWDYWRADGSPRDATKKVLDLLETTLARQPQHPLANHLYIHAVEARHPNWGVACADRVGDLVPDAGHLVHMPSHIYIRVGRYQDANAANERATAADESYIAQCHAQGLYALGYVPHNHHFLWFGKAMTGESADCLAAAEHVRDYVDRDQMRKPGFGTLQHFYTLPIWTYVRFGMWDEALDESRPADDLKYPRGVWRFARGMALARTGEPERARAELDALAAHAADESLEDVTIWEINTTRDLLQIAESVLAAHIAEAEGDLARAEDHLREAVAAEESLNYDEPPTWFIPVRQLLGAVLLKAGKPQEAEAAYRADLAKYPRNGWSLFGLAESLRRQGRQAEAEQAAERFQRAWSLADVDLTESRF